MRTTSSDVRRETKVVNRSVARRECDLKVRVLGANPKILPQNTSTVNVAEKKHFPHLSPEFRQQVQPILYSLC